MLPDRLPALPDEVSALAGRYAVYGEIASGGMATVYLGRLAGAAGFSRMVAIKRLHPHMARVQQFVDAFLDEARLAARVRHPNVVPTLDVVQTDDELLLVMEYVHGEPLSRITKGLRDRGQRMPPRIAVAIVSGVLQGLHAAHEATDEKGRPLGIVHRDVSPQNILVGADGVPRLVDFGVAKAAGNLQTTRSGEVKGKIAYMSPEQLTAEGVSAATDVYAAGVVAWEALTCERLFRAPNEVMLMNKVVNEAPRMLRSIAPELPEVLEAVVHKAMSRRPEDRFASAHDFVVALEEAVPPAPTREVAQWMSQTFGDWLEARSARMSEIERSAAQRVPSGRPPSTSEHPTRAAPLPGEHSVRTAGGLSAASAYEARLRTGGRRWLALGAATAIVGAVVWMAMRPRGPNGTTPAATVSSIRAEPTPVATQNVPPPPELSAPVAPPPSASASLPAPAIAPAPARAASASSTRPVPPPAARASASPCASPYYTDADGIRHVKRECM